MTKNAYFGPNLPVLWPKILILTGGSKSFGTHITEKPPRHLARIVYWSGMGPNGPKMPIFGQKSQFWANLAIYGPKILIFMWVSKSFGIHITEKPPRQLVRIVFRSGIGLNGPKMPIFGQKCQFLAKFGRFFVPFRPMPVGTWDTLGIKIPKPPYISSLKMVGFVHFSNFLIPSEKYYKLQSCWITL